MYKAACSGLKDTELWSGYEKRLIDLMPDIPGPYWGYIMWGLGKVQYKLSVKFFDILTDRLEKIIREDELSSFALMSSVWTFKRALYIPSDKFLSSVVDRIMTSPEKFRPSDFIRICNCLGFFGYRKGDMEFRDRISTVAMKKFDNEVYAQDFRDVVDHVTLVNLWNNEMRGYILERFRKIMITARPNHLLKAYESAVAVRVLAPSAWYEHVSEKTRGFYTSLAMRHIPVRSREMSQFHRQVSDILAAEPLKIAHRNMFRWGPFWIDLAIEDSEGGTEEDAVFDKKTCIVLDKESSFWLNRPKHGSDGYTEKSRIENSLLGAVGWRPVHVNFRQWKISNDRVGLLKSLIS
jgi:hypothetical protein